MQTRLSRRFLTDQRSPVSRESPVSKPRAGAVVRTGLTLSVECLIHMKFHQNKRAAKNASIFFGGDEEDLSLDLRIANATLYQLRFILGYEIILAQSCTTHRSAHQTCGSSIPRTATFPVSIVCANNFEA